MDVSSHCLPRTIAELHIKRMFDFVGNPIKQWSSHHVAFHQHQVNVPVAALQTFFDSITVPINIPVDMSIYLFVSVRNSLMTLYEHTKLFVFHHDVPSVEGESLFRGFACFLSWLLSPYSWLQKKIICIVLDI